MEHASVPCCRGITFGLIVSAIKNLGAKEKQLSIPHHHSRICHKQPVQQPGPHELAVFTVLHSQKTEGLAPHELRTVAPQSQKLRHNIHGINLDKKNDG